MFIKITAFLYLTEKPLNFVFITRAFKSFFESYSFFIFAFIAEISLLPHVNNDIAILKGSKADNLQFISPAIQLLLNAKRPVFELLKFQQKPHKTVRSYAPRSGRYSAF